MTFMQWVDDLSVGIDAIDDQHRWLVDTTNRLHHEMTKAEVDRAAIGEVIEGLMDYTMNHFIMEEVLFEQHAYPDAPAHKAQHDAFTATVMRVLTEFEDGADPGREVLDLLKNWLVHHIMQVDKAYGPYLRSQGACA